MVVRGADPYDRPRTRRTGRDQSLDVSGKGTVVMAGMLPGDTAWLTDGRVAVRRLTDGGAWEYLTRTGTLHWELSGGLHAEIGLSDGELRELGAAGWELIAAIPLSGPGHLDLGTFAIHYLFKRARSG